MHNSPLQNEEFRLAFIETNIRWLTGEIPRDEAKISAKLAEREKTIERINELKK